MSVTIPFMADCLNHRRPDTHKGDYGHALLVAGSYGKAGAAILAARACLRSGVGLLTVHVPRQLVPLLQVAVPEAMVSVDKDDVCFTSLPDNLERYNAVAMGPGLGTSAATQQAVQALLMAVRFPLVLDADALNCIARAGMLATIPSQSVLTPHDGEYSRLFGEAETAAVAMQHQLHIVRKGHHSRIYCPDGTCYVNDSGNPGMATAGSGDVLTGVILALLAQGLAPDQAARLGVYLHGRAGDIAVQQQSQASLIASDIIETLKTATRG
ncbi:MAG: NAD(P)H-hydrate dehydratase [Bacteroidales bacterium]|nr:NAD(P)H-hydrate dehydratase [Bacteroidales bacterium]